MTRVDALNVVINLLDNYLTSGQDTLDEYREAHDVLIKMRNNIQKQNLKSTITGSTNKT